MISRNRANEKGFTMIELLIVIAIIGLLAVAGLTTYFSTVERIKLQGDVRAVNQILQAAKMKAISTGKPHGVAFYRQYTKAAGPSSPPDGYFIFIDCNENYVFHGSYKNKIVDKWKECNDLVNPNDPDPRPKGTQVNYLTKGNYFTQLLGSTAPSGADLESIVFNSLGQAVQGSYTGIAAGSIYMQNHRYQQTTVERAGIEVIGASGQVIMDTIKRVDQDAWGPPS
jgi:prepilin-type N-terminal cleavage/methylation domain-containing protein